METAAGRFEEDCHSHDFPSRWIVSSEVLPLHLQSLLTFTSAFVAGLNNAIVQVVYLVQPDFAEDAGGGSFFQGV